ncbi:MAG: di-trans,poly-cis-decaprenylcistransferase [Clostridia bacterium]|nr:di-trans,poly-cis-decaprenylcistransferase [Clostridia bacterium]
MTFFKKKISHKKGKADRIQLDGSFRHIAFIMDGNGRWAKRRGMPREYGHRVGCETFKRICTYCADRGFETITVYAFSTENWKRPQREVEAILGLLEHYLDELMADTASLRARIRFIGDPLPLPVELQKKMAEVEALNSESSMLVNIALNYGGRAELVHAFNTLKAWEGQSITEADIAGALYTAGCGDPDMIVRTGGDLRISNFLLWQAAYAELYFTDKLWPDLTTDDVEAIIEDFYSRKRRYGGV